MQTFKLSAINIDDLNLLLDKNKEYNYLLLNIDYNQHTVTLSDSDLEIIMNELVFDYDNTDHADLMDAFTKQDKHNVIKEYILTTIQ